MRTNSCHTDYKTDNNPSTPTHVQINIHINTLMHKKRALPNGKALYYKDR